MVAGTPTDFQRAFVDEYFVDFDAAKAYKRAGGAAKAAKQNAYHTLKMPAVRELLRRKYSERTLSAQHRADAVIEDLEAFRNLTVHDFFVESPVDGEPMLKPLSEIQGAAAKFIRKIKVTRTRFIHKDGTVETRAVSEFVLHDDLKVLELLGRHRGLWKDLHLHLHGSGKLASDFVGIPDEQLEREAKELRDAEVVEVRSDHQKRLG